MTSTSTHETRIVADPDVPLVRITREFDAPPEEVFRAHTDPTGAVTHRAVLTGVPELAAAGAPGRGRSAGGPAGPRSGGARRQTPLVT